MLFSTALAAIFCLCSCTEKQPTTAPEPENLPVGFRPMSQAVWVKSDPQPLSDFHSDFGVWGIARHSEISSPYILWTSEGLTQVTKNNAANAPANQYIPTEDAYWLSGYTYNFIAIAPYTDSGLSNVNIVQTEESTSNAPDAMSFTFSLANKYEPSAASTPKVYDFDLMGAVAETHVSKASTQGAQPITFWHLLSQININIIFVNDEGTTINTGTVSQMRLLNIDTEADYTISFNNNNELDVRCLSNSNQQANLTFSSGTGIVNILPQNISDFEMYIDFTITDGSSSSPKIVSYNDFKINLNIQNPTTNPNGTNPPVYNNNESYSWNIKIGPKQNVSFKVEVAPWTSSAIQDAENNNEFEIN